MWKRFVAFSVVLVVLGSSIVGAVNFLVNPYDIFSCSESKYFKNKPLLESFQRPYKAAKTNSLQPETLIFGTSRTDRGIDPDNQNFDKPHLIFNASLNSATPIEAEKFFDEALSNQKFKRFIYGVDLFSFYAKDLTRDGFDSDAFEPFPLKYIFSISVFIDSIKTIVKSDTASPYYENGKMAEINLKKELDNADGHKKLFLSSEKSYVMHTYNDDFLITQQEHWKAFERILDKAHKHNIEVILFISPSHARQWEVLSVRQDWSVFEKFREKLVAINENEALKNNRASFVLWDFAGYHESTTENVPNDPKIQMKWYWDSSHYKKELGDIVLDRIFDGNFSGGAEYQDFGIKLTSHNIYTHLGKIRTDRKQWQTSHLKDVAEIQALKR